MKKSYCLIWKKLNTKLTLRNFTVARHLGFVLLRVNHGFLSLIKFVFPRFQSRAITIASLYIKKLWYNLYIYELYLEKIKTLLKQVCLQNDQTNFAENSDEELVY